MTDYAINFDDMGPTQLENEVEKMVEREQVAVRELYLRSLAATAVGTVVKVLHNNLQMLDMGLPFDYGRVREVLDVRARAGLMSKEQRLAAINVDLCYDVLVDQLFVTEGDVNDVWKLMQ